MRALSRSEFDQLAQALAALLAAWWFQEAKVKETKDNCSDQEQGNRGDGR